MSVATEYFEKAIRESLTKRKKGKVYSSEKTFA
jgi:hypothetical protein